MTVQKSAVTLVELLLYLFLLSFLALLVFSFCTRSFSLVVRNNQANEITVRAMVAGDLVRRDVMGASPNPNDWDVEHCVFKKQWIEKNGNLKDACIGFEVREKGLFRREGEYDFSTHTWITYSSALINTDIYAISCRWFDVKDGGMIRGVQISFCLRIGNADKKHVFSVALRNRVLS